MIIRNLAIARLPLPIRQQLNTRLLENEPAGNLVAWLNTLPEVTATMESLFKGRALTESDLGEWQRSGYLAWAALNNCVDHSQLTTEGAEIVLGTGVGAAHLLQIVTARLAELLQTIEMISSDAFKQKMSALQSLAKTVLALRKSEQQDLRLALERERLDLAREKQRSKSAASSAPRSSASPSERAPKLGDSEVAAPSGASAPSPSHGPVAAPVTASQSTPSHRPIPPIQSTPPREPENPTPSESSHSSPTLSPISTPSSKNGKPSTASPRNPLGLL